MEQKNSSNSSEQPGNHNNLVAILGSMLKKILGVEIPCAMNLPEEFLEENKVFSCIPVLTHDSICFVQIPNDIIDILDIAAISPTQILPETIDLSKINLKKFLALIQSKGITNEDDIDDLCRGLVNNMRYNLALKQTPPFYPWVWIPQKIATNIRTMITPFTRNGKKCFIHSMATIIPVNENYRIRNVFFTQLIAILLKRVEYNVHTKLEYSYYIDKAILYLFIAVIG